MWKQSTEQIPDIPSHKMEINIATICKKKSPDIKTCLIFPLKFSPHLSELGVCAGGRLNVVHDINVNVTEDYAVPVTGCS